MTDLTDKWKKGEFIICNAGKCQYYYVQNEEQREVIKTEYCLFDDNTPNWQILAPVPSYDEWKAKLEENAQLKERISKLEKMQYSYTPEEWNTMLRTVNRTKELLKECFEYIDWTDGTGSPISQQKLLDEINEALR